MPNKELDQLSVITLRSLCIDMINAANSGHPGMALGSAVILHTLFTRHLKINPNNSKWSNRDRFVLSAGHASSLLYALLHLSGYKLSLDDLKAFRQLNSLTPGHPEYKHTDGVDATSGPLGQGIAQAVGMAMASEAIRGQYKNGKNLEDHYTYALCGDGCLFEGVTQEAISYAGLQKLNRLILLYDANTITLDGTLDLSFNEDVRGRFISANWNVLEVMDGNDTDEVDHALILAKQSKDKPTLIICHTIIGYGSGNQGTNKVHGAPLGKDDGLKAKETYYQESLIGVQKILDRIDYKKEFNVAPEVYDYYRNAIESNNGLHKMDCSGDVCILKKNNIQLYKEKNLKEYEVYQNLLRLDVSSYLPKKPLKFEVGTSNSTRNISQIVLNYMMEKVPHLMGGSADVAHSVMTKLYNGINFDSNNRNGHNVNFGIREFGMAAFQNGILLHGGLRTYIGSFLVFADYMKSAIRHAALSKLPGIFLFSHDSIAVGEDGPTHQPIEHLAMLRSIPNHIVIRPADGNETYGAWELALRSLETPTSLILSRQNLPILEKSSAKLVSKGGYIVGKEIKRAQLIVLASGSEVSLALEAKKNLLQRGIDIRVVSMPSIELFRRNDPAYQKRVIGSNYNKRVFLEMLSPFGLHEFAKHVYGVDSFGASGKANDIIKVFQFDIESVTNYLENLLKGGLK